MQETVGTVEYKTGNYSLENITKAKEDVKNGVTYSKAVTDRGISQAALHSQYDFTFCNTFT